MIISKSIPEINYKKQQPVGLTVKQTPFRGIHKSQISDIDFACTRMFKLQLGNFETPKHLHDWAAQQRDNLFMRSFMTNVENGANELRTLYLAPWKKFLKTNEKFANNSTLSYIVYQGITKDLKNNNREVPPVFNEDVLMKTVKQIEDKLYVDKTYSFNFNRLYRLNLRAEAVNTVQNDETSSNKDVGRWVKINSRERDPNNYVKNQETLRALSAKTWCTKDTHTAVYLNKGDFYVYLVNNEPKLGVNVVHGEINEVRDALNCEVLKPHNLEILDKFMKSNNFNKTEHFEEKYDKCLSYKKIYEHIGQEIKDKNYEAILNYFGYGASKNSDGMLKIKSYSTPKEMDWCEMDVDENDMFQHISRIEYDADFSKSDLTSLHSLKTIGGSLHTENSKLDSLGNLESVGGNAYLSTTRLKDISSLKFVGKNLNAYGSSITADMIKDVHVLGETEGLKIVEPKTPFLTLLAK